MSRRYVFSISLLIILVTGCYTHRIKTLESIIANAPDASTYLINELKTKNILLINEDHTIMNEELFITENLQAFYDMGVRYIFTEENLHNENLFPTYPWMLVGGRMEENIFKESIFSLEQSTSSADPFKAIYAEAEVDYERYNPNEDVAWLNYREKKRLKKLLKY